MKIRENIEFSFTLCTFFGVVWFYLLNLIRDVTYNNPAEYGLIHLAFIHFIVFLYFIFSISLFFTCGVSMVNESTKLRIPEKFTKFLFYTWPIIACIALLAFVSMSLGLYGEIGILFIVCALSLPLCVILVLNKASRAATKKFVQDYIDYFVSVVIVIIFGFIVFLLLMGAIFSDIKIVTDKEFYKPSDEVIVSIRAKGYIFNPRIESAMYYGDMKQIYEYGESKTKAFNIAERGKLDFIEVKYIPQVISTVRKKNYHLNVAR